MRIFNNREPIRRVILKRKPLSKRTKKKLKWICIVFVIFVILCAIFVFVVFPLVFMNSIELQRLFMFTNLNLPSEQSYFAKYELEPGLRNFYVSVKDEKSKAVISLGVWHLLPHFFLSKVITNQNFDFDEALNTNDSAVLLYFHGTGEDRSSSWAKYKILRYFFHVITFDYRSYGDSSKGDLSENAVVNDCVQLYEWLANKTIAPIFIWGHSLGSALATRTVALLKAKLLIRQPVGLVLESAFTKMSEELYVHPYGKIFAWLPWFQATVIKPLIKNGFIFDTRKNILNVDCPIMILHAEDDSIVPYRFGKELSETAERRTSVNTTQYYQLAYVFGYDHNFIYQYPFLPFFINYFRFTCLERMATENVTFMVQ